MQKLTVLLLVLLSGFSQCFGWTSARDTVEYTVTFPNAIHHECMITITAHNISSSTVDLVMSNTSPGRYADHSFAKNVYDMAAYDLEDEPTEITWVSPNRWRVKPHNGYIRINYTLYANYADGTYSGIDRKFALLNIPSAFIWVDELKANPIKVAFEFNDQRDWEVSTQLPALDETTFYSPKLEYFLDSPVVLASSRKMSFMTQDEDSQHKIALVISPDQHDQSEENYLQMVQKVVEEQKAVFGEYPDYEYGQYTFLCNYGPAYHGDGMEHRNSTIITNSSYLEGNELNLIGTVSHEFFHCWNVERLRPESLEPFDFTKVNMSEELWFSEGFTSYYGDLVLVRSGIYYLNTFLQKMSGRLNYVLNAPGTGKYSPVLMSQKAPFVDASSFIDETNFTNTFTSYYSYGAVLAMALDLEIRDRFSGKDLDGYMRYLWLTYGRKEIPFSNNDLESALTHYTSDKTFSTNFFQKYIYGTETPEYESLLNKVGLSLEELDSTSSDLLEAQFSYSAEGNGVIFLSDPIERSTYYLAGINQNDIILSIDGIQFQSLSSFISFLSEKKVGATIKIKYLHLGEEIEKLSLVKSSNAIVIKDMKSDHVTLTPSQESMRDLWLNSKVK